MTNKEDLKARKKFKKKLKKLWLKDPVKAQYLEKADEMKFNEKIDDEYTKGVIDKYQKGYQKNHWFSVSAIISILIGIACLVGVVIIGVMLLVSSVSFGKFSIYFDLDIESNKRLIIASFILLPLLGVLNLLVGLKIGSFANYTRDNLMNKSSFIMMTSFFQCIIGGTFICILTIVGYFVGRGIDYGAIYYNKIDEYNKNELAREESYKIRELRAIKKDIFSDNDY